MASKYYALYGGGYFKCGGNGPEYKHSAEDVLKMFSGSSTTMSGSGNNVYINTSPKNHKNISDADVFLYEVPEGASNAKVHYIKSCCSSKMKCKYNSNVKTSKLFNNNANIWYALFYVGDDSNSANTFTVGCDYNDFSGKTGYTNNEYRMPSNINEYFNSDSSLTSLTAYYSFRQDAFPTLSANTTTEAMFSGCTALTKCEVPGEMQIIGKNMFKGCTALTSYTENPDFITKLDASAFTMCTKMENLLIPAYASISDSTFKGCTSGKNLVWDGIGSSSDTKCNMTEIPQYAFSECTALTNTQFNSGSSITTATTSYTNNIVMARGITGISTSAFEGCRSIKKLTLNDVTSIGQNAFSGCTGLTTIDYKPSTLIYASGGSFANCTSLTSLTFSGNGSDDGKTYWNVAEGAFDGCTRLSSITFDYNVKDTSNVIIKSDYSNPSNMTNVYIGWKDLPLIVVTGLTTTFYKTVSQNYTVNFYILKGNEMYDTTRTLLQAYNDTYNPTGTNFNFFNWN
jgi:hypothetical protein